jgi:glycine/D-amino acid oxidase-like deaminating enzyme
MNNEILIIGGGVAGVTTGVVLRLRGYSTRILCRHWLGDADSTSNWFAAEPRYASQYPAASIIPHSVKIADEAWHMRTNLRLFEALHFSGTAGVRKQRHYEVYEAKCAPKSYAPQMPSYRPFPEDGSGEPGVPRRKADVPVFGWSFQTLFAEMPRYRKFLARLYQNLGGELETGRFLDLDSLRRESAETIVNCAGAWGPGFWGDALPSRYVKGTLVRAQADGRIPWNLTTSEVFSYNYYPAAEIYALPDGSPADVYFYPRTDGWLLGGTRLESGDLPAGSVRFSDETAPWVGEAWNGKTISVPQEGVSGRTNEVPAPIITLNRDIIYVLTGLDVAGLSKTAMIGYRHKRETVRLECATDGPRRIIHNYGHGGAGVTLSWSCAIRAASLIGATEESCLEEIETSLVKSVVR